MCFIIFTNCIERVKLQQRFCKFSFSMVIVQAAKYIRSFRVFFLEASKRRGKPKCLLVYSPTRLSHINVMIELAKYLRICDINAMIDMLDVTDTTGKVSASSDALFIPNNIFLTFSSSRLIMLVT